MGYYSTLTGELRIEPPITWGEYKQVRDDLKLNLLDLLLDSHVEETDTGRIETLRLTAVTVAYRDQVKAYDLEGELARIAAAYGESHVFTGYIVRVGEEQGDVERYKIDGIEVHSEKATLRWPDDTDVYVH